MPTACRRTRCLQSERFEVAGECPNKFLLQLVLYLAFLLLQNIQYPTPICQVSFASRSPQRAFLRDLDCPQPATPFIVSPEKVSLEVECRIRLGPGPLPLNRVPWHGPSWLRPKNHLFAIIAAMFVLVAVVFERFLIDYRDPEWKHIEPFSWCTESRVPAHLFWTACGSVSRKCIAWSDASMWHRH